MVARLFNLIGADVDARTLLRRVEADRAAGEEDPRGSGEVRDFLTVEFAARALVALAIGDIVAPVVNVCTGVPRTPADVVGFTTRRPAASWAVGDPALLHRATGLEPSEGLGPGAGTRDV